MKISDCCGAYPIGNGDMDYEDIGICSECKDHCEYINEDETESDIDIDRNYFDNDADFEINE